MLVDRIKQISNRQMSLEIGLQKVRGVCVPFVEKRRRVAGVSDQCGPRPDQNEEERSNQDQRRTLLARTEASSRLANAAGHREIILKQPLWTERHLKVEWPQASRDTRPWASVLSVRGPPEERSRFRRLSPRKFAGMAL